jgi:hypothetical protein
MSYVDIRLHYDDEDRVHVTLEDATDNTEEGMDLYILALGAIQVITSDPTYIRSLGIEAVDSAVDDAFEELPEGTVWGNA